MTAKGGGSFGGTRTERYRNALGSARARARARASAPRSYRTFFTRTARTLSSRSSRRGSTASTYPSAIAASRHAPVSRADPSAFR